MAAFILSIGATRWSLGPICQPMPLDIEIVAINIDTGNSYQ